MSTGAAGPARHGGSSAAAPAPGLQDALFPAVGGEGRVEAVVRRLGEAIGLGLLEVGERLPPETQLAARFDVAPVTLREALAILRQAGMLETRRGRGGGTFVRGYAAAPEADELRARLQEVSPDDLRDLGELRKAIAGAASELAAKRAAPREIAHLRVLLERMGVAKTMNEFRRGDGRLHVEIAAASRSSRLTQAELAIQSELSDLIALLPGQRRIMGLMNREHAALVDALDARDGALARRLAEQHVDSANDLLIGLVLGPVDE
jgi:GntR family transcriptional regulator, transcriptional repressor for pyruvate dehydrogenase complex